VEPFRGMHCCAIAIGVAVASKASRKADLPESVDGVLEEAEYCWRSGDVCRRLGFISQSHSLTGWSEKNPRFRTSSGEFVPTGTPDGDPGTARVPLAKVGTAMVNPSFALSGSV